MQESLRKNKFLSECSAGRAEKNGAEYEELLEEIKALRNALNHRDKKTLDLKLANETAIELSEKLNKSLVEEKAKHALEHDQLNEKHKSVVNNLEKSLTLENKRLADNILTDKKMGAGT